jgi:hypothetical protein
MAQLITLNNIDTAAITQITGPRISGILYPGDDTAASIDGGQTVSLTGTGFQTGLVVYVNGAVVSVASVVSASLVTFVTPVLAAGSYTLLVVNTDGGTATFVPGIQYSGVPAWSTAAGSLGTVFETDPYNYSLSAVSDSAVSYAVTAGTIAAGAALNAATGSITGNANLVSSSTTYNFTVDAVDQEQQNTGRNFSITVDPDVVTFNSPAVTATYANVTGDVFSLTLNATSAMGKTISYSANVLPGGLSISGSVISGTFNTVANSASAITATAATTNKTATRLFNWAIAAPPPTEVNYGWFGGGSAPSSFYASTIDRVDYSQDTVTASVRGNLLTGRRALAATGNTNFGWFGGGQMSGEPGILSIIERITFGSDTATAAFRSNLPFQIKEHAATGNEDRGWFSGGAFGNFGGDTTTAIHRIIYASDTATSIIGSLSLRRVRMSGAGNAEYGWYTGGAAPSNFRLSIIDRITYSSDTTTASVRGPLSGIRSDMAATSNAVYGWIGAGWDDDFGVLRNTVDRINFVSDTATASVRGPLTLARWKLAATGNSDFGWFGGGQAPASSPSGADRVDRITYASDTVTASVRGPLSSPRLLLTATGGFPG